MPFVILAAITAAFYFITAGKQFKNKWKYGFFGVALMAVADYFGAKFNLYLYRNGIIYIGVYPVFHIIYMYLFSLLYLQWLPDRLNFIILYTICASVLFLGVEAAMYSLGAIEYMRWKLWYSFFLDIGGLLLLASLYLMADAGRNRAAM